MVSVTEESQIQTELERIVASAKFRDSAALRELLRYVVERTLAGRENEIKEYNLGLEVFHRPPEYDPRRDAIVRVQASLLRKKLAAYYSDEGSDSELHIDLPRGGYIPRFVPARSPEPVSVLPVVETTSQPRGFAWSAFALGIAVASVAAFGAYRFAAKPMTAPVEPSAGRAVWGSMLDKDRPIIVGVGMPRFYSGGGGFYVRDVQQNEDAGIPNERLLQIERALGFRMKVHDSVYTGVGEAMGAARIGRWLDRIGARAEMANSHDLGPSDLDGKDLVVISSMRFQTILHQMNLPTMFPFDDSGAGRLINRNPAPGEQTSFETIDSGQGVSVTHALLTVLNGVRPGTRILYAGGIHSWATNGATQFAVDAAKLRDLEDRLSRDPENGPRGRRSSSFEVLLRVEGKNDQTRSVDYVTHRYLPAAAASR